uniref:3-hydroxyacyl-CoA dehydrogenase n=1 Tax=Opuntia streptacantha TaxID=393608 RepID=A0A7C9DTL9_OPUST
MEEIKTIGVVGAGQMGSGIAQLAAVHGIDVWLLDSDPNALRRATEAICNSIQRLVSKGQLPQAVCTDAPKRIHCSTRLEDFSAADFVIEAVAESEAVKKKIFSELDMITKSSAILASNTSSISITRLASATSRPHKVCIVIIYN